MKLIPTVEAVGHVLCHDLTRIVPGVMKDAVFRKGHIVTADDIPLLLSMGKENLFVWEKLEGMVHEDEAADFLYHLCAGKYMSPGAVKEGKINIHAECDGLLVVNEQRLQAVNELGDLMIATRRSYRSVKKGDIIAGTRIIPLMIDGVRLEEAKTQAGDEPLLQLRPFRSRRYAIIATGNEIANGMIEDAFTPVIKRKLEEYGCECIGSAFPGDDVNLITAAIHDFVKTGAAMVFCTGGMSVDPDDRTPLAILRTGADIITYGAPVLPGAMFLLAYLGSVPVVGLPGCVMYLGRTIFDLMLPRLLADIEINTKDIAKLGHGGLCMGCKCCSFPNCTFGVA